MEAKPLWQSWTFWFNLAVGLLYVLQMPEVQALNIIPAGWMAAILAVGNIILRIKTKLPVGLLGSGESK